MKKKTTYLLAGLVVCSIAVAVWAQSAPKMEGSEPYTPTKLEWLALRLNANHRTNLLDTDDEFMLIFVPIHKTDTIRILVYYDPEADRKVMNMTVDAARKAIDIIAEGKGWDGWVQIKEEINMFDFADDDN